MTALRDGMPPPSTTPDDRAIATTIGTLLDARTPGATICPSEVARALIPDDEPGWRALMPQVRAVAATLARDGQLVATRRGSAVDATSEGGPIRLGRLVTRR